MISEIALKNFKRHTDLSLHFDDEVTAITGANAAGKSSILKAILYALFGASAAGAKDHLWTWDASGDKYVELTASLPGYGQVKIKRSDRAASVKQGERMLASGHTPVNDFIQECMGMDSRTLLPLMYSAQGETQGLLEQGAAKLQRKVEEMAQVDVIDKVLALCGADISVYEGVLSALPDTSELPTLLASKQALELEQGNLVQSVERARIALALNQEAVRVAATAAQQARKVAEERARVEAQLEAQVELSKKHSEQRREGSHALSELISLSQIEAAVSDLEVRIAVGTGEIRLREKQLHDVASWAARVDTLSNQVRTLADALPEQTDIASKIAQYGADIDALAIQDATLTANVASCKAKLRDAIAAKTASFCASCLRPFSADHTTEHADKLIAAIEGELAVLRQTAGQVGDKLSGCRRAHADLTKRHMPSIAAQLEAKQAEHAALQGAKPVCDDDAAGKLRQLTDDIAGLDRAVRKLNADKAEVEALHRNLRYVDQQIADTLAVTDSLKARLAGFPSVDVAAAEATSRRAVEEQEARREALTQVSSSLEQVKWELQSVSTAATSCQDSADRRAETESKKTKAGALQTFLRKNRGRLADSIWQHLLDSASMLLHNTTNVLAGGHITQVTRASDGAFLALEQQRWVPVSELSGAQRSIVGLALRISMNKVFYGTGLPLLLDEATADARGDTAAAVGGMLQSLGMQVISVTHRSGDMVNADSVVALEE